MAYTSRSWAVSEVCRAGRAPSTRTTDVAGATTAQQMRLSCQGTLIIDRSQRGWTYDPSGDTFNDRIGRLLAPTVQLKASSQPSVWEAAAANVAKRASCTGGRFSCEGEGSTSPEKSASHSSGPAAGYIWVS